MNLFIPSLSSMENYMGRNSYTSYIRQNKIIKRFSKMNSKLIEKAEIHFKLDSCTQEDVEKPFKN